MNFLKHRFYQATLILLSFILLQGCDKNDTPPPANTITSIISSKSELSLFKAALMRVGLNTFTDGPGPFTVLAPNNAAFNAIGITTEADINAIDANALTNFLTYHIIPGSRPLVDLPRGPNAPITSQGGGTLFVASYSNATFFNGVQIVGADMQASNGYVHILNRVLVLPVLNALQYITSNPDYSLFLQAINKGAAGTSFSAAGPITVFAPNNAAFIAAGLDATAIAASTTTAMANLTRYHIHTARLFSSDFKTDSLRTVFGPKITMNISGGTAKVKGTSNPTGFSIINPDFVTTNGVVHTINGVLKP